MPQALEVEAVPQAVARQAAARALEEAARLGVAERGQPAPALCHTFYRNALQNDS
jgi:hypothetical protein